MMDLAVTSRRRRLRWQGGASAKSRRTYEDGAIALGDPQPVSIYERLGRGVDGKTTFIDITLPLGPRTPIYPGDTPVILEKTKKTGKGFTYEITRLVCTTHSGTHLDAPRHFILDGKSLDEIPPSRFVCRATVVDVHGETVAPEHVPRILKGRAVLFRTRRFSKPAIRTGHDLGAHIAPEAAEAIIDRGANLVGIDSLSVDGRDEPSFKVHKALLGADILILEGLDLTDAPSGNYMLFALPLRISEADGSPVRALLVPEEESPRDGNLKSRSNQ